MTKSICHYETIPSNLMDIIEEDLANNWDSQMQVSRLQGNVQNVEKRNSQNAWVPTTNWLGGLVWHYFKKSNDDFFNYKIDAIDCESMQYTHYGLNERYDWHIDEGLAAYYKPQIVSSRARETLDGWRQDYLNIQAERVRKLSAIIQLSEEDDYEGGSTQIMDVDQTLYTLPKQRGTIVFFDSRLHHRAKTVKKGLRKSLICWAVGPRWK